jgi:branched-chain amino acid transport system permease protein
MTVTQNLILVSILRGGIYALVSVGFSLTLGVMNISNFAHGEFYMLGAYAGYFAFTVLNLPPLVAMLLGALFSFGAGVLVEKSLLYRLRKMGERDWLVNSFLLTAGLSVVLQNLVQLVWGTTYRGIPQYWAGSLQLFPGVSIAMDRAASLLIACSAIVALWVFLSKTKTGRAIRAVAQDSTGAVLVGIDLDKMQTLAFAVGCALAGLAGAILLYMTPAFPDSDGLGKRRCSHTGWVCCGAARVGGFLPPRKGLAGRGYSRCAHVGAAVQTIRDPWKQGQGRLGKVG